MVMQMLANKSEKVRLLFRYFPDRLVKAIECIGDDALNSLCEIRVRADKPIVLVCESKTYFLTDCGRLTGFYSVDSLTLNDTDISSMFSKMCNCSVYTYTESIINGFITLESGIRIGVYGTAVTTDGKISALRKIRGLNIRIPSAHIGVSSRVAELFKSSGQNVLICGPPSSGKTTVLKDLCRYLSDDYFYKLAVIDERGELSDEYIGFNTDILSFYPKAAGIEISVRTLSPDIIVCDEFGNGNEINSVLDGLNSGVNFVLTLHCDGYNDLFYKNQFIRLIRCSEIDYCVFLKNKSEIDLIINREELADAINIINPDSRSTVVLRHNAFGKI